MNRIEQNPFAQINEQNTEVDLTSSGTTTEDFSSDLASAIDGVKSSLQNSDGQTVNAVVGDGSPHDVMLALSQAELSFRLVTQVRNKLLDAYREIMRMQL
jgi:flagellar hook-basal body complex protein FliE